MKKPVNKKVRIIPGQNRLYRSPQIKLKAKKRSRVFESIPVINDEKRKRNRMQETGNGKCIILNWKEFEKNMGIAMFRGAKNIFRWGLGAISKEPKKSTVRVNTSLERESKLNEIGFN